MALGIVSTKPDSKKRAFYAEGLDEIDLMKLVDAYNHHLEGNDEPLMIFGKEHAQWETHGPSSANHRDCDSRLICSWERR